MAVGNAPLPVFIPIEGVRIGVTNAGVKQTKRPDIAVFEIAEGATVAGVFTKNAFCAAPVQLCRKHLGLDSARYLLVNTGNANAGTGESGMQAALSCVEALSKKVNVPPVQILPFSTGVIGEPLPVEKVVNSLDAALADLSADNWKAAATAIMTTDTRPKGVSKTIEIAGHKVNISGISKGAGMIRPNMATMLSYVATDARVSRDLLQDIISEATRHSFNRITIDGDTSTNDSAILIATGKSGLDVDGLTQSDLWIFRQAIILVFVELAQLIIKDGEGATKFVHVKVDGGLSEEECEKVAFTVAESPLVKTALFASDPNWGRILAAVGRSGVENLDVTKVGVIINDVLIAENGGRSASYTESAGAAALAKENIFIHISLQRGDAEATVWTTDLSYDYVKINAEYRS
jgi:glutamate N-acetyltransferase / amino-acid N-acetyltransferase